MTNTPDDPDRRLSDRGASVETATTPRRIASHDGPSGLPANPPAWRTAFAHPADIPSQAEEALALRFAAEHGTELRYCATWNSWMIQRGGIWYRDTTLEVSARIRALCRGAAEKVSDDRVSTRIASQQTVSAIERLARADPHLAATAEQWDQDRDLLGTPGGLIDLRRGAVLAPDPARYVTRCTAVDIAQPGAHHAVWDAFLNRVTGGNSDLIGFLQRVIGYCLTGHTREHAVFFLHGSGANGKSIFLRTIAGILHHYAASAPIETFMASHHDRHPTDLADLRGARFVYAVETEEGRRWAEAKLKQLSGGDPIKARFMRQDFFEYVPQFKLVFAGNHRPSLRGVDEAIRRRLHLIPFTVSIPPNERDPGLFDKLRAEWPAILRWMIKGCLAWQRLGLQPPASVADATQAYLNAEDLVSQWITEFCVLDSGAWTASRDLYGSFRAWAEAAGEHALSEKRLVQALEDRGFERERGTGGRRGFVGLRLAAGT